jgi:hypothetical protein
MIWVGTLVWLGVGGNSWATVARVSVLATTKLPARMTIDITAASTPVRISCRVLML